MSDNPHKDQFETKEISKASEFIIERHEDGSECRKCTNCACMNNKLAKAGIEENKKKETSTEFSEK